MACKRSTIVVIKGSTMNKYLAAILLNAMKGIASSDLMDHILALVRDAANTNLTGDEKRAKVQEGIKAITGDLGVVISGLAGYVLNLAIEVAVAYVATHAK